MTLTKTPGAMIEDGVLGNPQSFAPNTQWQLWGQTPYISKQKEDGTGAIPALSISAFNPANANPTLICANTGPLRVGDIGRFGSGFQWGYQGRGYQPISGAFDTGNRVVALNSNSSFSVKGEFGGVSPLATAATSFQLIGAGDTLGLGLSASGWLKSAALNVWADDYASNLTIGAIRVLGARKTSAADAVHYFQVQPKKLRRYAGRTITFGAKVFQKLQGGSGTWALFVDDGVTSTISAFGKGQSQGGYEFKTLTVNVNANPLYLNIGIVFKGNSGDIYYVALPTAVIGSFLSSHGLGQRLDERMESIHWNPPLLTPMQIQFPNLELISGTGLYGWNQIDLEAISTCACHKSIATTFAKFEWKSGTVGAYAFASDYISNQHLRFGVQTITQTANVNDTDSGEWPLYEDGTIALYGTVPSLDGHILTLDFWDAMS
ncbi:hypothetical protein [Rhizobium tumorigenes]|uniref:hypothetical protein n=1 Tax=Rhizobium tumorigenes TaxID=2041385 RepID=UPI00241D29C6|nr:hypothetical protein [Rhizobium tumorigenes]WFS02221.1 hypothetical protein PR016_06300 [Rhizobium tumorigenes]